MARVRTGKFGRVEMWRGGLRYRLSVAASFVWRCLNIGLEDRFQNQHGGCHAHPIPQARYTHRSLRLLPERKCQFTKPSLDPARLNVREVLTTHTRCPLVGAALGTGMRQDVFAVELVVQGIQAEVRLCLPFRV